MTLEPSRIFVLTNWRIKNSLFDADDFSYMFDNAFIKLYVVFLLNIL